MGTLLYPGIGPGTVTMLPNMDCKTFLWTKYIKNSLLRSGFCSIGHWKIISLLVKQILYYLFFMSAVMAAEVVRHYFPRLVELHNYTPTQSTQQKLTNWNTLNRQGNEYDVLCLQWWFAHSLGNKWVMNVTWLHWNELKVLDLILCLFIYLSNMSVEQNKTISMNSVI